jgi:hypothetical protein
VGEIFRSVFFVDQCVIEVREGTAPIQVSFESGTEAILDAAFSFGAQFRGFCRRIHPGVRVVPVIVDDATRPGAGTFAGDLLQICSDASSIHDVLGRSKLADLNTLAALHKLVAAGRLRVEGLPDPVVSHLDGRFATLKSCIDSYQFLHALTVKAFDGAGLVLPTRELAEFALALNEGGDVSIYLANSGGLTEESIGNILKQCSANLQRLPYFRIRIESLIRYLLQMAGDMLPFDSATSLKRQFREISQ